MKKLGWVMDGGFWDLDMSTPLTIEGTARPVPGSPLPLGLSRGIMLSRPKQLDFMHRFMAMPFVPSYTGDPLKGGDGFVLQRVITLPFGENWFATLLGKFHVQKLISSLKKNVSKNPKELSWLKSIGRHFCDKSLYALGFSSEFLLAQDYSLFLSSETHSDNQGRRNKAIFHQKLTQHNLTVEAVSPGLFVDKFGTYWDVPLSVAIDLASVTPNSGSSYHVCVEHNSGKPVHFGRDQNSDTPPLNLQPGLCVKSAFSIKKDADIWRKRGGKLRMVQPFDVFLSNPHISVSAIIGAVVSASFGGNVERSPADQPRGFRNFSLHARQNKSALMADFFASLSCTAQHGNFQKLFFDLTRLNARLDFPSGLKFVEGATHLANNLYNSQHLNLDAVHAVCPDISVSLQQQIVGPLSIRVDSRIALDLNSGQDYAARVDESVFALEYALKVLGSAKAVAWYSTKRQEAMVELRFFEN